MHRLPKVYSCCFIFSLQTAVSIFLTIVAINAFTNAVDVIFSMLVFAFPPLNSVLMLCNHAMVLCCNIFGMYAVEKRNALYLMPALSIDLLFLIVDTLRFLTFIIGYKLIKTETIVLNFKNYANMIFGPRHYPEILVHIGIPLYWYLLFVSYNYYLEIRDSYHHSSDTNAQRGSETYIHDASELIPNAGEDIG